MIGDWPDGDGLLGESVEEQATRPGASAIEPEGEFVEVVIEMTVLNAALVSANQPSLEKRGDIMHPRHDLVSWLRSAVNDGDLMLIACSR